MTASLGRRRRATANLSPLSHMALCQARPFSVYVENFPLAVPHAQLPDRVSYGSLTSQGFDPLHSLATHTGRDLRPMPANFDQRETM